MKSLLAMVLLTVVVAAGRAADPAFSQSLRPEDFAAAGLPKLTPAELERLDRLVRDFHAAPANRGPVAAPAASGTRSDSDPAPATHASAKPEKPGVWQRAKVLLQPGTAIEYTTLESRLVGNFEGWQRGTVFRLENGQRWRVVGETEYVTSPVPSPKVKVVPGTLGSFFLEIEGVRSRAKVESLDAR